MNQNLVRTWNVLCWNVRGINAERKWDAVRNKVLNVNCDIVYLQETKEESFDQTFIRKILPSSFDDFIFVPSVGASGGLLVAWKSLLFSGLVKIISGFAVAVEFCSKLDNSFWTLMNVYGPCTPDGKFEFTSWIKNLEISNDESSIIMGDFNLYRYPENRNREGADINDMFLFNSTISYMGWSKIPLQGQKYTWSNMQLPPLLEKLDWVFTNNLWTLSYPETSCKTLVREVSDHTPLNISISTSIPKSNLFRFENFWLLREDFKDILMDNWHAPDYINDKAKIVTRKCKNLSGALKAWSSSFSNLKLYITNISLTIKFFDSIEELRDLSLEEWNFRNKLRDKLLTLLEQQRIYWRQRGAIKWATLSDAGTKFFHANATLRHGRNFIANLKSNLGDHVSC